MSYYDKPLWETKHWLVKLSEDQTYLGRAVVIAKGDKGAMSELVGDEISDLWDSVVRPYEAALRATFGAEMFNWTYLMNNAYQKKIPDPHVHWHLKPRYRNPVEFEGQTFVDEQFGHHYKPGTMRKVSDELADKIVAAILAHKS